MLNTIARESAKLLILATSGKIFSVQFIKKDGTQRDMVCRLNVQKHLKGGKSTTAHVPNLITVFEMDGSDEPKYRCINADTLTSLKVDGNQFAVID